MSPRRYRMQTRTRKVANTRRQIVDAAIRLHGRQGSARTSWDDIALEAGVSRATVYQHFPSLETLIPECSRVAFDLAEVPSLEQAAGSFGDVDTTDERVHRLIHETCKCYAAGATWLRAAWRERDLVPAMNMAVRRLQQTRDVLVSAATQGLVLDRDQVRTVGALLDFAFWDSLDREGMSRRRIPDHIEALVRDLINPISGGR